MWALAHDASRPRQVGSDPATSASAPQPAPPNAKGRQFDSGLGHPRGHDHRYRQLAAHRWSSRMWALAHDASRPRQVGSDPATDDWRRPRSCPRCGWSRRVAPQAPHPARPPIPESVREPQVQGLQAAGSAQRERSPVRLWPGATVHSWSWSGCGLAPLHARRVQRAHQIGRFREGRTGGRECSYDALAVALQPPNQPPEHEVQ
jgi:hypothetical protein